MSTVTTMTTLSSPRPLWRAALEWAVLAISLAAGAVFGFDFGHQVTGGALFGIVTALMGAVFCSIVASAAVERAVRLLGGHRS
jgi:hypothetical protein